MKVAARDVQALFGAGVTGALSDGQLLDRFIARREGAIFEAIVHRHGPMVWGVCRRILRDHHDAEDAFQATFLVLARKAASVIPREKVGHWLYGVAYQTALKARATRAKRRMRERSVPDVPEQSQARGEHADDRLMQIDCALNRLPAKYRILIVLCELQEKTHKEAAEQLGWPVGTVSGRLSRARSMLAKRVSRSGLALPGGALAVLFAQDAASASMPTRLIDSTAQAASLMRAGRAVTAEVVSTEVMVLVKGVLKAMLLSKIRAVAAALLTVAIVGGVGGMLHSPPRTARADAPPDKDETKLQGLWTGVVAELAGRRATPGNDIPEPEAQIYIKGDRLTLRGPAYGNVVAFGGPYDMKLTFKVDGARTPKAIDLTLLPAPDDSDPTTYKGIYRLEGDDLLVCLSIPNKKRPEKFATETQTNQMLLRLKRDEVTKWTELPKPALSPQPGPEDK